MSTPPRHALVTGGAGFIGHHLVRALLSEGLAVTVLDDLSMGRRENVPEEARFIEGDVRDRATVRAALEGVDAVFHEAAIVSIRASVDDFVRDADVNFMGTLAVLAAMGDATREGARFRKAVFASSMAVYADGGVPEPMPESWPTEPLSPYGVAKLAAERAWLMTAAALGVDATALRYFNTYGPGQTPTPYVGVITIFAERLLAGRGITVFGDGEQRRDFVHVDDIVGANLAVLRDDAGRAAGRTFNVGTGRATSVNEIAARLCERLAPDVRPEYAEARPEEMRAAIADTSAIRDALGWTAQRTELDFEEVVAALSNGRARRG